MKLKDFIELLIYQYEFKDDNYKISIGHWESNGFVIPEFYADISITIGQLREMYEEL